MKLLRYSNDWTFLKYEVLATTISSKNCVRCVEFNPVSFDFPFVHYYSWFTKVCKYKIVLFSKIVLTHYEICNKTIKHVPTYRRISTSSLRYIFLFLSYSIIYKQPSTTIQYVRVINGPQKPASSLCNPRLYVARHTDLPSIDSEIQCFFHLTKNRKYQGSS